MSKLQHLFSRLTWVVVFAAQFIGAMPALARDFTENNFPILSQTAEQLAIIVSKGTREKDGKRLIMTAHLSFPVERKRALVVTVQENSANTLITGEKDLVTGEVKIFLNFEGVFRSDPQLSTMSIFDGELSTQVPLIEISKYQSTVSGSWTKVCNVTGCFPVPLSGYNLQHYVWRSELPITALRAFVERKGKADDRLIFWLGTSLDKASKQARKISNGNRLLFRNQAEAVLEALEIAPR